MRILLLNQFFAPDLAPTGQLLTDLARELVSRGHQVTVICGASSYVAKGTADVHGIRVRRIRNLKFGRGKLQRLASYLTYVVPTFALGLEVGKQDLILSMTTPPGLPVIGDLLARIHGAQHFIWEMDVYPDIMEALGMLRPSSTLSRLARRVFDAPRHRAQGILTLGECMAARLESHGLSRSRIHITENWLDNNAVEPMPIRLDGQLRLVYSGNLGLVHEFDTVARAIWQLRDDSRFEFIFAGVGRRREQLERFCKLHELSGAVFDGHGDREQLSQRLGSAHVGLVSQRPEMAGCVVPSKVYGIMAAERPVLFIGPAQTAVAQMIHRFDCGWHVQPGDVAALVGLLCRLVKSPEQIRKAGANARKAFLSNYSLPVGLDRICRVLTPSSHRRAQIEIKLTADCENMASGRS